MTRLQSARTVKQRQSKRPSRFSVFVVPSQAQSQPVAQSLWQNAECLFSRNAAVNRTRTELS